jgi:hypothetical protein
LNKLLSERARIDKEIVDWKRVIDSLLAVSENDESDPPDAELGDWLARELGGSKALKFTDGIRIVLRQNASRKLPISVPEIRDQLINLGFNFAKYAQPLVPIHNSLKRLAEQGEVSPVKNEEGQILGYTWISPIERALVEDSNFYDVVGGMRPLTISPPGPANSLAGIFKPSTIRSRAESARLEAALKQLKDESRGAKKK